ncbi:MAG: metalloprotease PmbA [Burkholderiaceae bacterium]|jgi:PmbA protein
MSFSYSNEQLTELTALALAQAAELGATDCAVDVSESAGLSVGVRLGEVETIERTQDKSFSIDVYVGQRKGSAASSDFSQAAILQTVRAALDIARYTAEDDCAGLPEKNLLVRKPPDLDLYHPWSIEAPQAVERALAIEAAALDTSPMIRNSDGAGISSESGHFISANSRGFLGGYAYSRHSCSVSPIAQAKKSKSSPMERDYWYSSSRRAEKLADPGSLGRYAAERALARLGARRIATRTCPVVFEAPLASGLVGAFVQAVSGGALYRRSSFLLDQLGKSVWAPHIDIVEDPFIPQGPGSSPFDDEGVKTARRKVIDGGKLRGYFLSSYSARKLGMKTTGNAGGSHNLLLTSRLAEPNDDLAAMLKKMGTGLLVTELMGQGVNYMTGDYSRGAFGYWVENGRIVYPVQEITIAGNLRDMFQRVVAVGTDVMPFSAKQCGSILVESMTVASGGNPLD